MEKEETFNTLCYARLNFMVVRILRRYFPLLLWLFYICECKATGDFCFKVSKEDHRLNYSHILQHLHAESGIQCIFMCMNKDECCRSVNYRKYSACDKKENCELLYGLADEEHGLLTQNSSYDHYVLLQPKRDSTTFNCPESPCLNGGRCVGGCGNITSFCNCSRSYRGKYCDTYLPSTCTVLKSDKPEAASANYTIQPDKNKAPFAVFCNMTDKNGIGVTVFGHDSEEETHVNGYEDRGSYRRMISYNGMVMDQIENVINSSRQCEQFIKYECRGSIFKFHKNDLVSWWVSRQGYNMTYWGGATLGSGNCSCGMTESCRKDKDEKKKNCNCDANLSNELLEDSGYLVNKEYLPVSELRFGDTGDKNEEGYHTLGKLLCWG